MDFPGLRVPSFHWPITFSIKISEFLHVGATENDPINLLFPAIYRSSLFKRPGDMLQCVLPKGVGSLAAICYLWLASRGIPVLFKSFIPESVAFVLLYTWLFQLSKHLLSVYWVLSALLGKKCSIRFGPCPQRTYYLPEEMIHRHTKQAVEEWIIKWMVQTRNLGWLQRKGKN